MFFCEKCGEPYVTQKSVDKVAGLFKQHGADVWFTMEASELLPGDAKCSCGGTSFKKETDILDVWFDSGVSHAAVLEARDNLVWPADLYLEGSDQHRGWFHSALLTSVGTRGKAPYKAVLTHGYVVDEQGRKMSKSVGNIVAPKEVIQKYGAEILRLWVSASDYRDDVRISDKFLKQMTDAYRRIRNTCRFILGNLADFDPGKDKVDTSDMTELDRFILHRLQGLIRRVEKAYQDHEFHAIYHSLYNFCTLDLSAFYLDVLKDRLYTSMADDPARRSAQTAVLAILEAMVRMMAPILVFTAEDWIVGLHAKRGKPAGQRAPGPASPTGQSPGGQGPGRQMGPDPGRSPGGDPGPGDGQGEKGGGPFPGRLRDPLRRRGPGGISGPPGGRPGFYLHCFQGGDFNGKTG